MGMIDFYIIGGDCQEVIVILYCVVEFGLNFFDIVDMYGLYSNEELFGEVLCGKCEQVFLVSKFGIVCDFVNFWVCGVDGSLVYICCVIEGSLKCFGIDCLDLYYQYCMDLQVFIEDSVGVFVDLVKVGKICYIGFSEVLVEIFECVYWVYLISVLQSEYLLWICDLEDIGVFVVCCCLGIVFVFYSLLG